ncbi:MAG: sugar ABC transporter substrate-binding protein [Bacillota bacterium]|nr:sugar ABC transporter substrate-binding protein [Bacillota bacterium]
MKRIVSCSVMLVLLLAAFSTVGLAATYQFGASAYDPKIEFNVLIEAGIREMAQKYGVDVNMVYTDLDAEKELQATERFIRMKKDALIINPLDSESVYPSLVKAKQANIPVAITDTAPNEEGMKLVSVLVTSDNYDGGRKAGELMVKVLGGKGNIVMTEYEFRSAVMDQRYAGFLDAIKGTGVKVIERVGVDGTRESALAKLTPILAKHPDLDGIFCSQGDPAIGALAAVEAAGRQKKIKIISFDVESEVAQAIKRGSAIVAGVTQFPDEMGRRAVVELINVLKGKPVNKTIYLPVLPVTRENIDLLIKDRKAFLEKYGGGYKVTN